ncbi:MAG: Mut7-C RNAse domain-containing protein [Ardenticatenia bacterium]|nr:Mut7-C RNAse domain-containing protein [Ardenticatenia bacterium]
MHEHRFAVDAMLGRLATWLRLLGYDAFYEPHIDDRVLIERAQAEGRTILTRDVQLTKRRGVRALLITSDSVWEQLRQVVRAFSLAHRPRGRRCPRCNLVLVPLTREAAVDRVPAYVWQTQETFHECPGCQRVFWRGTHIADMEARLAKVFDE